MYYHLEDEGKKGYFINLDPAVQSVPYGANIDIRDTVDYRQVFSSFYTSRSWKSIVWGQTEALLPRWIFSRPSSSKYSNLWRTKPNHSSTSISHASYVMIDTPGQIEVFNWSASGTIISESLATTFPTCLLFVVDTPRCKSPSTFMSNMLYACR